MKIFTKHKQLLFKLITTSLFLFSMVIANAATITWNGGNGSWQKSSNWDLNRLPNANDKVILPNGTVTLSTTGYGESVFIDSNAELEISTQGQLQINLLTSVNAIECHGIILNMGTINLSYAGPNSSKVGLKNHGEVYTEDSVSILGNFTFGIVNEGKGYFDNEGYIVIDVGYVGIENHDYFVNKGLVTLTKTSNAIYNYENAELINYGDIDISNHSGGSVHAIVNKGLVTNNTYGDISIDNITSTATIITNNVAGAKFRNKGDITISNCTGYRIIHMNGQEFINYQSGSITMDKCDGNGMWRENTGITTNSGDINFTNHTGISFRVHGQFNNNQSGLIYGNIITEGFFIAQNSTLNNFGLIEFKNESVRSARTSGTFINYPSGTFRSSNKLNFQTAGTVTNHGHLISSYSSGIHPIYKKFVNYGVVNDIHHVIDDNDIKNYRIMARPIYEVLAPGQTVYNVLQYNTLANLTILNWYTSENGSTIAGSFNAGANSFTPNNNVSGLNSLWVAIRVNSSNIVERHEVILSAGTKSLISSTAPEIIEEAQEQIEITIGPNPATEYLNINSRINSNQLGSFELINLKGQKLLSGEIELNGDNKINFSNSISSGIYFLNIWSENKLIKQEKIVVQK